MKILHINSCNFGSTGKIMYQLASISEAEGFQVYCCYPKRFSNSKIYSSNDIIIGSVFSRNLSSIFSTLTGFEDYAFWLTTKLFIRKVRQILPDVIHLHNLHGFYINYRLLFEYLANEKVKVVWTLHDCWAITGHCPYFNIIGCEKWVTQCYSCPQSLRYPKSYVDRSKVLYQLKKKLFLSVDNIHIVSVSQWVSQYIQRSYLSCLDNSVIFNGIDTRIFKPTKSTLKNEMKLKDKFVVIAVASSWSNDKGLDDFVKLSTLLDDDCVILLVGLESDNKLPANIIGIKKTENQNKLAELYSMADILCSLSYSESFGLTIIESMACGTPAVVYNNSAQRYLVNSSIGMLVSTGDVNGVDKAIRAYRGLSTSDREKMGNLCVQNIHVNFEMMHCFKRYINLYRGLVNV